jgi:hypothetical protein
MALIKCCFYRAEYLAEFDAVHIIFKGEVNSDQIIKLRNMLGSLSESLKIEKIILDFTECDQVFIDYNSHIRIAFWKNLENHGLKMLLLIIPPKNFTANSQSSWESFYKNNKLNIEVSAISDRNLMPLFILNNTLSHQINQHYGNSN